MDMRLILNILGVCGSGVFTGAMLVIGLTLGTYWQSLPPSEFLDWFAANGNLIGNTIPLYVLPTVIGLLGSAWLAGAGSTRTLWLVAFAAIAVLLIITFAYHLPLNARFAAKAVPVEEVAGALSGWMAFHWARIGLGLVAAVTSAIAISR